MTSNFEACWAVLLKNEGGFTIDNGGQTMWGVTEAVARRWGYKGDMRDLPQATAKQIAKEEYWNPYSCDSMPTWAAVQVLDAAYNGGYPVKWLQLAIGVTADGKIGLVTLKTLSQFDCWKFTALFIAQRLEYLASLKQPQYANGRMNRMANDLRQGELQ